MASSTTLTTAATASSASTTTSITAPGAFSATNINSHHQQHQHQHQPQQQQQQQRKTPRRSLRPFTSSASTPNLNSIYHSSSSSTPVPALPTSSAHFGTNTSPTRRHAPSRKTSLVALTSTNPLASIPDVTEGAYSFGSSSALREDPQYSSRTTMAPTTPGRSTGEDVAVGDAVDVPGGMQGVVRFVGQVQGKKGTFAGVELDSDFAARGKNNGDVDGISYFNTIVPGAGIFLPVAKALRRGSGPNMSSFPFTPSASMSGLKAGNQNSTNYTPPTPSLPKFSASVGPGARAPSPGIKRPRTSLPRPDSPVRRTQMTPGPRPSIGTPAKATSSRYAGSPTNRFAQSVRGTAGDPSKKTSKLDGRPSMGPRSVSALGSGSGGDDDTPVGNHRMQTNGSIGSVSSLNAKMRPASRANGSGDDEINRLKMQIEERDRQLREQSTALTEMESTLTELQGLMEHSEIPQMPTGFEDKDSAQLRQLLREKNDKIAMLTAEFDAHRADFRSTIDTLEMASTETERVYEKRMEELMTDIRELESRNLDVDSVASQLKQLEELVQELEEGLEDARRGEAEARGEVEFLRGEVERTRAELRREREQPGSSQGMNGMNGSANGFTSKDMEQKEDEIRGLKAIIHSLSRDSVPQQEPPRPTNRRASSLLASDVVENKIARDNLERQVAELQSILDKKTGREEELEKELESLKLTNANMQRNSATARRSSLRDSRDTVILARAQETRSPEQMHRRNKTLDTMAESDYNSSATENSTLWCEICETGGHDILTCTNMFGPDGGKTNGEMDTHHDSGYSNLKPPQHDDAHPAPLSPLKSKASTGNLSVNVKILPNPMESGPVAGKDSGVMDPEKWCAVCERDGHDSVDCPFEDAF